MQMIEFTTFPMLLFKYWSETEERALVFQSIFMSLVISFPSHGLNATSSQMALKYNFTV
jgi:hypothetical protein